MEKALTYKASDLNKNTRINVNAMYDELINELQRLRSSSEEIHNTVNKLNSMQAKANSYYDNVEEQLAIEKKKEEARQQEKARRLLEEEKKRQAQRDIQIAEELRKKQKEQALLKVEKNIELLKQKAIAQIKLKLKSPSTASFENITHTIYADIASVKDIYDSIPYDPYRSYERYCKLKEHYSDGVLCWFSGDVNAQNSYGAMMQNNWFCSIFYSASEDYYLNFRDGIIE